jgi:hypothetical protein
MVIKANNPRIRPRTLRKILHIRLRISRRIPFSRVPRLGRRTRFVEVPQLVMGFAPAGTLRVGLEKLARLLWVSADRDQCTPVGMANDGQVVGNKPPGQRIIRQMPPPSLSDGSRQLNRGINHCSLLSCVRFNAFLSFEPSSRSLNVFRSIDSNY